MTTSSSFCIGNSGTLHWRVVIREALPCQVAGRQMTSQDLPAVEAHQDAAPVGDAQRHVGRAGRVGDREFPSQAQARQAEGHVLSLLVAGIPSGASIVLPAHVKTACAVTTV
jgi:hypothetical protein